MLDEHTAAWPRMRRWSLPDGHARVARLAGEREARFPPIGWMAVGVLPGLAVGALAGYLATGGTLLWSILGLWVGMAMGMACDRRRPA